MVAIYIPVLQSPEPVYTSLAKAYKLDYKKAIILRALYACNEAKDNHITCLGTAVSCNRRCRNSPHKWTTALAEMIDAAEDGCLSFEDLKVLAPDWAAGLACYLHGKQRGVAMAVMGAIAVYRQTLPGNVVSFAVQHPYATLRHVESDFRPCSVTSLVDETKFKMPKSKAQKDDCSRTLLGESQRQAAAAERLPELQRLKIALLSIEKVVLLLCKNIMLLLEQQELLHEVASLLAEEQDLLRLCEK